MAIGADQAAGTEFDAAKVTRDDDDDIGQFVLLDGFENGVAGGAARLAVIV